MRNYISELNIDGRNSIAVGGMRSNYYNANRRIGRRIYCPTGVELVSSLKNQNKLFCSMLSKWRHSSVFKDKFARFMNIKREELLIGFLTLCNLVVSGFLVFI